MRSKPEAAITITRIEVRPDRLILLVQWPDGIPRDTDKALARAAVARYPDLPVHNCVNERGERFGDVIDATPGPHLLEHVILSEMTTDEATPPEALLCATSQWVDREHGLARLELAYRDDLVALRAVRQSLAVLNELYAARGSRSA